VTGGAGISGNVYIGGNLDVVGTVTFRNTVVETSTELVQGVEIVAGNLVANSGTASTSTTTGALVVAGGAGISGAVYAGSLYDNGTRVVSTSSGAGNLSISSGAITLPATGPGSVNVGSATSIPTIVTDAYGRIVGLTSNSISTSFTVAGTTGTATVSGGSTLSLASTNGVTIAVGATYANISTPQDIRTSASPTFAGGTINGTLVATTVNAGTIGNTGATLTGTLSTASQTTITAVGTLTALSVSGTATFTGNTDAQNTLYARGLYDNSVRVVSTSSGAGNLTITAGAITLPATGPGATTVGSATAIPVVTTDAYGRVVALTSSSISTSFTVSGTSGTTSVAGGSTLSFASTNGVTIAVGAMYANVSTPQDIRTSATPSFAGATVNGTLVATTVNAGTIGNIGANMVGTGTYLTSLTGAQVTGTVASATVAQVVTGLTASNVQSVIGSVSTASFPTLNQSTTGTAATVTAASQPSITTLAGLTSFGAAGATTTALGNLTIGGNLIVNGNSVSIGASTLSIQDPIINLNTPSDLTALTTPTTADIGLKFHYYDTADSAAFVGRAQDTGYLEWYSRGTDTANVFTGTAYGTIKSGAMWLANTTASTGTTSGTAGALYVAGGAGVAGNVNIGGQVNIAGNVAFDGGQVTHYDSIIDLHTYGNLSAWATDDGRDIGLRMHYYSGADSLAFLGLENTTKTLQFLISATEVTSNVTGTFGNAQMGSMLLSNTTASTSTATGALIVAGGVGVAGNLNVGGNVAVSSTGSLAVPVGTTAQRISLQGAIRYNTTLGVFESYDGSAWNALAYGTVSTFPSGDYGDLQQLTDAFGVSTSATYDCNSAGSTITSDLETTGSASAAPI
jgi:hypothetical protein